MTSTMLAQAYKKLLAALPSYLNNLRVTELTAALEAVYDEQLSPDEAKTRIAALCRKYGGSELSMEWDVSPHGLSLAARGWARVAAGRRRGEWC